MKKMKTLKLTAEQWAVIAATVVTVGFLVCVVVNFLHSTGRI